MKESKQDASAAEARYKRGRAVVEDHAELFRAFVAQGGLEGLDGSNVMVMVNTAEAWARDAAADIGLNVIDVSAELRTNLLASVAHDPGKQKLFRRMLDTGVIKATSSFVLALVPKDAFHDPLRASLDQLGPAGGHNLLLFDDGGITLLSWKYGAAPTA